MAQTWLLASRERTVTPIWRCCAPRVALADLDVSIVQKHLLALCDRVERRPRSVEVVNQPLCGDTIISVCRHACQVPPG